VPVLVIVLLLGVFGYLWWQRRTSTLTRLCAWRQERAAGQWRCVACGAVSPGDQPPRQCLRMK
jgi:hypothetical protein